MAAKDFLAQYSRSLYQYPSAANSMPVNPAKKISLVMAMTSMEKTGSRQEAAIRTYRIPFLIPIRLQNRWTYISIAEKMHIWTTVAAAMPAL